ncbi:hypothetical protein A2707_04540 [Candidatus Saccharibacteria bacterium RIFCSPHIGHO2_01_FULL_45_15]|nr:MAG: hypothetical protein A2707_04540 [Candidatus Saccharibacteria bacterium RIFCSPHIGHO2_01_FULL_45_15]OGL27200.1 MAG: hypothetical protein A3C39_01430 [Candidatus Saccharibacteria bacterium RIFCSPHIGHO2_02_FULL_46_12]OGL32757.1 MAG: hypothetical protein A3E76_05420 [Candidatus Saccharibacteria bacterium RIFCSPHIGHO2_12_FULL_44_22]
MARLPQPGGDAGNWGSILNDYLSQSHKSDGTIKDGAVDASAVAVNTVSKNQLQAGLRSEIDSKITQTTADRTYAIFFNVKSPAFGALGNGVNDDRAAIQAACDAAVAAGGGIVYLPEGTYMLGRSSPSDTELLKLLDRVTLRGAGKDKTLLFLDPTTPTSSTGLVGVRIGNIDANVSDVVVEDLELNMNTSIINASTSSANQLWGIGSRFEGATSLVTAQLCARNITVRRCRVLDSRIAITFAKVAVSTAVDDSYLNQFITIEDNEVNGTWNRSIEVAFSTNFSIRRNVIRGRGFLHVLAFCYMGWVEDNDIEYGRDAYSMTGNADKPGASAGPTGLYLSTGIHHIWISRNYIRAHKFASTAVAGAIQIRTEQWALTLVMHHIYFTDNILINTTATSKRVLDFNTQSAVLSNTIHDIYFYRDTPEGAPKLYGGTSSTLHINNWQFDSCTLTEPIDAVDHSTVDVDDIRFVRTKMSGAQAVSLTNSEFERCVFPGSLTLTTGSSNIEVIAARTANGSVVDNGTGNVVTGSRTLLS